MSNIFEIVDKTGRKIRLTKERWSHITSPASPHAYMANYLEEVKQTLQKSDRIMSDVEDDKKSSYYRYYKIKKQFLKIIVKYLNGEGFIISSYFVRNIVK